MYKVRLQQFEGPLDLLLFFIRRDELDIHDIPIARIADEFLEYVTYMEEVDLDGVGDFLYMAAVLINIKARMLLPSQQLDDEGEPVDPRAELVERLLEYIRFKEASDQLEAKWEERSRQFIRGAAFSMADAVSDPEEELVEATVFDLITALRRLLTQAPDEPMHEVEAESFSMEEQQAFLRTVIQSGQRLSFVEMATGRSKPFIIATFLAVLEMARTGEIDIFLAGDASDFHIASIAPEPSTETETPETGSGSTQDPAAS
ncbi:MAG: segregation/condensation protein A [Bacteroidetes bacterium]|nr:segregation/condensation protein A [Bacteroidota bacterium]